LRTRAGDVLGTPQYMSPEQTRGDKLDGRSDLFSAGIVLYQMLAGARPFRGDSLVAVATKIANETGHADREVAHRRAGNSLRRVIDRCLAKSPAQRFQTGPNWPMHWSRCWPRSTRKPASATAPHRAAAREVGADDGADRRRGDGRLATP
jgi:serine/threonine protein kinase